MYNPGSYEILAVDDARLMVSGNHNPGNIGLPFYGEITVLP